MEKVKILYDRDGHTLNVWFDDPSLEDVCEEADDDTILRKDASGRIIGFEKLNVTLADGVQGLVVEVVTTSSEAA